jgi:hypothetical protein
MYYNNGEVYTNHWSDWSGTSKITGEVQKNTFHCWWQWEGDKIVSPKCFWTLPNSSRRLRFIKLKWLKKTNE